MSECRFKYEIKQHKKDGHEYAEITGYEGKVAELIVPPSIDGKPVEAIGNHAFSGREDIESIFLPESIRTLYGFAFHNCRNLRKISLFDSLDDYYDGVCRQCDSLKDIDITVNRGWFEVIRNFLADNDRTLRFLIHEKKTGTAIVCDESENDASLLMIPDYEEACLTFPEYVYDFNENTMARTIQFSIAGAGMFYRECVDRRKIDYRQYDALFEKAVIDGQEISESIAIGRILYPIELSESAKTRYEAHLRYDSEKVLRRLISRIEDGKDSVTMLDNLLSYKCNDGDGLFVKEDIESVLKSTTAKGNTVISAVLMDKSRDQQKDDMEGTMEFFF